MKNDDTVDIADNEEEKKEEVEEEKKTEEKEEEEQKEQETELSAEEYDDRIIEAFKRAIFESITDKDLPLEPSDFQKNFLSQYSLEDQTKLDIKKSNFKKIGKLMEAMSTDKGDGIILYREKMKGHKVI